MPLIFFVTMVLILPRLKELSLVTGGLPVPGVIASKELAEWTVCDPQDRYKIFYHYPVRRKNGKIVIYEKMCMCDKASFDKVAKGESVTVLHNKHLPSISTVYVLCRYKAKS
ncbi:MAG: hypothetical protein K2W95_33220 [Candidatus Obscuribacterales bacterium]|nr:hypothetical protein [Candidatus Obscuribacterales bacterium]